MRRLFTSSPFKSSPLLKLLCLILPLSAAAAPKTRPAPAKPAAAAEKPAPAAPAKQQIVIAYVAALQNPPPTASVLEPFIPDLGVAGAELAISDNNTTGQFTGQEFVLKKIIVPADADLTQSFQQPAAAEADLALINTGAESLVKIADSDAGKNKLLFDIGSSDDALRNGLCRRNVLHILPNRAMRADALAQYMLKKRWQKWFLVIGQAPGDSLYAEAIKRAAKRYGMKIVTEKTWTNTFNSHRSDQADVPEFTQGVEYDVLVAADETGAFGEYLDYHTWSPRPVIGTQGLIATAWHPTHEQWGASQLQNRFKEKTGRWLSETEYAAYIAVRSIGEAAIRAKTNQMLAIRDYLLSPAFALQGYKGAPLSFRPWDGQLRQPVLLAAPREMVAVAPLEGFLHPKTELDTLGYDQPETGCKF